ncbi:MAG: DUF4160 domain-containing protein [Thermomicrobiales bacterium]
MVEVIERGRFRIYVFREVGQPHHWPHCHVLWPGETSSVRLSGLSVLGGESLPRLALALLREHQRELVGAWNRLNPEEAVQP